MNLETGMVRGEIPRRPPLGGVETPVSDTLARAAARDTTPLVSSDRAGHRSPSPFPPPIVGGIQTTRRYGPCPCGCDVVGKLTRSGHAFGCSCRSCTGKRNRANGRRYEREAHRALGGSGFTPVDEGSHLYTLTVKPQVKGGRQVPASLVKFLGLDWTARALSQAKRAIPVGAEALPAILARLPGGEEWLLVRVREGRSGRDSP